VTAKDRPWFKANHRLSTPPKVSRICKSIPGGNKKTVTIAGNSACCPYSATNPPGGPPRHAGRIIHRHTDHPAVIHAAITRMATIWHIKNVARDSQRATFALD